MDIALAIVRDPDTGLQTFDFQLDGHDLQPDYGLKTPIVLSLFCDRQSAEDDPLADSMAASPDRRGWWADRYFADDGKLTTDNRLGSRFWLLAGSRANANTARLAELYAREALGWLIADGIATAIDVSTEWIAADFLGLTIVVSQKGKRGEAITQQFEFAWNLNFLLGTAGLGTGMIHRPGAMLTEDGLTITTESGVPLGTE